MTVKKNNRPILSLTVLLFVFQFAIGANAAQLKNILRIRFETVKIKPSVSDIVLNVYYKLEVHKPVNFHGFECRYSYDAQKLRPNTVFFDGTACQSAEIKGANNIIDIGEYRVEVLSGSSLDTTNAILFQVRYSVKEGFADSAMIAPTRFDALSPGSGIDSVIIENTGRDEISWFPFGLVFVDTTTPPPPTKKSITLSSDSADIQSDSLRSLSLNVSSLDSANVKSGIFEFDVDTAAFDSVAVLRGALLGTASLAIARDTTHVTASFSSTDAKPFVSSGEFLKIVLRGKERTDTLCTKLLNPKFTALNGDNRVSSAAYRLGGICVLGKHAKDTVTKGVTGSGDGKGLRMEVYPNPARSFIDFHLPAEQSGKKHLVVCDALGKRIFDRVFDSDLRWEVASVPAGLYTATVVNFSALQDGVLVEKRKILIIH